MVATRSEELDKGIEVVPDPALDAFMQYARGDAGQLEAYEAATLRQNEEILEAARKATARRRKSGFRFWFRR